MERETGFLETGFHFLKQTSYLFLTDFTESSSALPSSFSVSKTNVSRGSLVLFYVTNCLLFTNNQRLNYLVTY